MLSVHALHAGSATWQINPSSGDWNTAGNWNPATVPNAPADVATFAISNVNLAVSLSANTEVNGIVFTNNNFTITAAPTFTLTLSGAGITNNSGTTQTFVTTVNGAGGFGQITFTNSATAGINTAFTNNGATLSGASGGFTQFFNTSTAGNGAFTTNGGLASLASGGSTQFFDSSTAGNGTFTTNGGTISGADGGRTDFSDTSTAGNGAFTINGATVNGAAEGRMEFSGTSTAGNGTFTTNGGTASGAGGGRTQFFDASTAGSATLIANDGTGGGGGGVISFFGNSTGGTTRVEVFGTGKLDISGHSAPNVTIGSIEGTGNVFLGRNNLTVGSNNLSTTFSGVIQDGGINPAAGGSLTKIGSGTLTFQGGATNNYIADSVSLSLVSGSTVNLNFSGSADTIGFLIVNGVAQADGLYGSAASGAPNQLPEFAGTGQIQVVAPQPVITSPLSATATVGQQFVYQFETRFATSRAVTNLPPGLTFNAGLSAITGTPTVTGTFQTNLSATGSGGTTNATLTIMVQPAPPSGPVIASSTSATGRPGQPFSFQVVTTGGTPSARVSASGLPAGLSIDAVTGLISGTPTSDGGSAVTLTVTDGGLTTTSILQLTFTSDPAVPVIISSSSASLTPGQAFSYTINAPAPSDPSDVTTYALIGALPNGLFFDAKTGIISGTFTASFQPNVESPNHVTLSGGIVTNVQLFATNSHGTSTIPLNFFLAPTGAVNIATRLVIGTGDEVLIAGFIITGNAPKKVIIRAIGPSLSAFGIGNALQDTTLELHDAGSTLGKNDDWRESQEDEIMAAGLAPTDDRESAILATLAPGNYTAIVAGKNTGGIAVVEVYDLGAASLDSSSNSKLANIATRGPVLGGDNVMIGGFIVSGQSSKFVIRAIGPSLAAFGITGTLQDPTLALKNANGVTLISNDDWQQGQPTEIQALGLAPTDPHESALLATLGPGQYTAIVSGKGSTSGVALVEVYSLQ